MSLKKIRMIKRRSFTLTIVFLFLAALPGFPAKAAEPLPAHFATYEKLCRDLIANSPETNDAERLGKLFEANWDYLMHDSPEWATDLGYPGLNHLWTDFSAAA